MLSSRLFLYRRLLTSPTLRLYTSSSRISSNSAPGGIGLERKPRENENLETLQRRLQYQMRKRGILETDLLLSTFASEHLLSLSHEELVDLDSLLSNIDWDIFYWATKKTEAPEVVKRMGVFEKLMEHAAKRGTGIVRMPDLEETK
ncbi:Succinate dehydrogenase assembly factor 2 mitochondrial [Kickxella alabastrina]|uniref:Succinate dehydrogenase assembly factor 2 mitochondrial n=1 Tax=Kickxella alabastrina TaxID=61397 RepID=A0ACC1I4V6_9FUNG|nr:Succinate dehydrogenase assembly factor 2 mitochondrial [Kickxella alabastrina]